MFNQVENIEKSEDVDPWRLPRELFRKILQGCNTLLWAHNDGLTLEKYNSNPSLKSHTTIVGVGTAPNDKKFVGILKNNDMPYYSFQFHPEKNAFEHKAGGIYDHLDRSPEAVQVLNGIFSKLVSDSITARAKIPYKPFPEHLRVFNTFNFISLPFPGNIFDNVYYFMDLEKNCAKKNFSCKKFLSGSQHEDGVWKLYLTYREAKTKKSGK